MLARVWNRLFCIVIGYVCGNFLTAEVVTRKKTGKPCKDLGTSGNPGMTNVLRHIGLKEGAIVLGGDILKTVIAMYMCLGIFGGFIGKIAMFYAGFGAILGHDFPVWQHGKGGKGVTCLCTLLILYSGWGFIACIIALATIISTKYLCLGGVVLPAAFVVPAFYIYGTELGLLTLALCLLFYLKHRPDIRRISTGECEKIDVIEMLRSSFAKE